jgi:hypothetical protein
MIFLGADRYIAGQPAGRGLKFHLRIHDDSRRNVRHALTRRLVFTYALCSATAMARARTQAAGSPSGPCLPSRVPLVAAPVASEWTFVGATATLPTKLDRDPLAAAADVRASCLRALSAVISSSRFDGQAVLCFPTFFHVSDAP